MQFHILTLFMGFPPSFQAEREPLFPPPSPSPFIGSTATVFPRYGVSRFSLPNTRPLAANEKGPSASLGMTIRETCFPLFFYLALVIHPAERHFERSEKSFSSPFSHDSFAKPFTESTAYRLSCEKDPSAPLGMTIREKCFLSTAFAGYVG